MATETNALWCVVPAAGRGTRFGGAVPKQYLPLAGRPLILHTLERLAAHPRIAGLMVVLAAKDPLWPKLRQNLMDRPGDFSLLRFFHSLPLLF